MEKPPIVTKVSPDRMGFSGCTLVDKNKAIYTEGKTRAELKERTIEAVNDFFKEKDVSYLVNDILFKDSPKTPSNTPHTNQFLY